jgi:patatin-related protein
MSFAPSEVSAVPTPPAEPPISPKIEFTNEVRFAVVMYGGVSLAIYINGVAQELLRWVRSTAKQAKQDIALLPTSAPLTDDQSPNGMYLSGTERVYRKLSYILSHPRKGADATQRLTDSERKLTGNETITTRFVVDILSGTSAGGINGIFLAKALANGQDIASLESLWIQEGDIQSLINDKKSVEKPLTLQNPPASLLNSQRMYFELLKAFDGMDKTTSTPFVDEMDLFVTNTDLAGVTLPIRLSDGVVYERRHRNVLRFVYSDSEASGEDSDRNDFESFYNPFLAYAARCTSAFPVAFEPMCLCDTDVVLDKYGPYAADENCRSSSTQWQRFYKDYLNPAGVRTVKFPKRPFADGGYLDNKPFSYATETLARRQADLLVTRKLLYIEPSPEHPEDEAEPEGKPDAISNVGAALLSLPRYETIREDLQRLRDHNRLVERVNSILKDVDQDRRAAHFHAKPQYSDIEWGKLDLAEVVNVKGPGYVAYHRLSIAALTDDLAGLVTRVAGFDEESDYFLIIRSLVRAWRARNYIEYGKGSPSLNTFLFEFNLAYPMRRINFLRTKISELSAAAADRDDSQTQAELLDIKKELNGAYKQLRRTARFLRSREKPPTADGSREQTSDTKPEVPKLATSPAYQSITNLKKAIVEATWRALPDRVRSKFADPSESVLEYFLGNRADGGGPISGRIEQECNERAKTFLDQNPAIATLFDEVSTILKDHIGPLKRSVDTNCRALLGLGDTNRGGTTSEPPAEKSDARRYLAYYYEYYDDYDRVIFPIIYGTEIGEAAKVDIVRVSPEDAKALINERETGCYKLAGTALGHFGAFLDPLWRKNDILWGRLDGAERIITALLPDDPELARSLIGEAHGAIMREALTHLGKIEAMDLVCESSMRTKSGNEDCALLEQFITNLKENDRIGDLNTLIDNKALRQHYIDTFPMRSQLDPESTVRTAARATTVIGRMLSALSDKHNVNSKSVAWIARLGVLFSSLVEVSVPRSIPNLLFRHWLKLLYLFEVMLIIAATLLSRPGGVQLGWTLLGITVSVNVIAWLLNDFMQRRRTVFRFVIILLSAMVALFAVVGALKLAGVVFGLTIHGLAPLNWVAYNLDQVSGWFESILPKAVWLFVKRFLALLALLAGLFVLWQIGGRPQSVQQQAAGD